MIYIGRSGDTILNVSTSLEEARKKNIEFLEENEAMFNAGELNSKPFIVIEIWEPNGKSCPIEEHSFECSSVLRKWRNPYRYIVLKNSGPSPIVKNNLFSSLEEAIEFLNSQLPPFLRSDDFEVGKIYSLWNGRYNNYQIVQLDANLFKE